MARDHMRLIALMWLLVRFGVSAPAPALASAQCRDLPPDPDLVGDAVITALMPLGNGTNCSWPVPWGMRRAAAIVQIVNLLAKLQPLPSINIGLRVVDSCPSDASISTRKALMSTFVHLDCQHIYSLGILTTEGSSSALSELTELMGQRMWSIPAPRTPEAEMAPAVGALLAEGPWPTAAVLSVPDADVDADTAGDAVVEIARARGACVRRTHHLYDLDVLTSSLVVLIGPERALRVLLESEKVPVQAQLMLVPSDGLWTTPSLAKTTLLVLPNTSHLPSLKTISRPIDNTTVSSTVNSEQIIATVGKEEMKTIARTILKVVQLLGNAISMYCPLGNYTEGMCPEMPSALHLGDEINEDDDTLLELLSLRSMQETASLFTLERSTGANFSQVGRFRNGTWTLNGIPQKEKSRANPECPSSSSAMWIREPWVAQAAILTTAALGTLCVAAVTFFIVCRIIAGDVLEGSAWLSLVLLLSVVLSYAGALAYCVRGSAMVVCRSRIVAAPLAYSLLLGVMLGRSLMLATCGQDGVLAHVSGHLQTALCFFAVAVQAALSGQMASLVTPIQCATFTGPGSKLLLLFVYDAFLLVLLCLVSPFILASRRNYREGRWFARTSVVLLMVWTAWISCFLAGGPSWHDSAVASGLVASATAVLVGVFIPRTYLMAGAMVRDRLASQLPALARYNMAYDTNFGTGNLYDTPAPIPVTTSVRPSPSPLKVTEF